MDKSKFNKLVIKVTLKQCIFTVIVCLVATFVDLYWLHINILAAVGIVMPITIILLGMISKRDIFDLY